MVSELELSTTRRQGGGVRARAGLLQGGREVVSELELVYNKKAGRWY